MRIPKTTKIDSFCKKAKSMKTVTGILKSFEIDDIILHFYRCEDNKCQFKTGCAYMFPTIYYECLKCGNITPLPPKYLTSPIGRVCRECGEIVTEKIPPNTRLMA